MYNIKDEVGEPASTYTKHAMVLGDNNVVIEDTDQPQTISHKVYDLHNNMERKIYTDQTGTCMFKPYRSMQYVMVLYKMDLHAILVERI